MLLVFGLNEEESTLVADGAFVLDSNPSKHNFVPRLNVFC